MKKEHVTKTAPRWFDPSSPVSIAMRDARVSRRDGRGLMSLSEARRLLESTEVYRKGEGRSTGGTMVFESDRVWAALLSLEDAAEFVKHATRIRWEFQVRGRDNVALHDRYGDGILPWIERRVEGDGALVNVPWCVLPCLLAIGTREALEVTLRVRSVVELASAGSEIDAEESDFAEDEPAASDDDDEDDEEEDEEDDEDEDDPSADEDEDEERGREGDAEKHDGLEVARRWMTRHPDAYGALAALADEGNTRAAELLRDRAAALGGVVREAIEAALGPEAAKRIAEQFSLPRTRLPEAVERLLAEADVIDEPRGPLWSIAELDEAARRFDLPIWDNTNYTTAAMRITGYASQKGDALVIEQIVHHPGSGALVGWHFEAYGPGAGKRSGSDDELVDATRDELQSVEIDADDYVDGITNQIVLLGERDEKGRPTAGSDGPRIVPLPLPSDDMIVHVKRAAVRQNGDPLRASYRLPRSFAALPSETREALRLVTPAEALVVDLCRRHRDAIFAADRDLRVAAGVPQGATRLFSFDDFQYVAAGEPASRSMDLVAMVEALRARRKITRLPGAANARPERWIPAAAEIRSYAGGDAWAEGDDPVEPEPPAAGVGVTPYWSLTIARGFPHGVWLLHGAAQNKKGQAEQAILHLMNASSPVIRLFWPRRTACMWARATGLAERKWVTGDRGVLAAAKNDRMLYAAEARRLVENFVLRPWSVPPHVGAELVLLLEALVGGRETVDAFVVALGKLSPEAWASSLPALASAIFELGFVLHRVEGRAGPLHERLERAYRQAQPGEAMRLLDLVLHGRAGAERSARCELDLAHVGDDPDWVREKLLDRRTPASAPDVFLVSLAGEGMLAKYEARIPTVTDAAWVGSQLARLASARVVGMALAIYADRPEARAAISQALFERPEIRAEIESNQRGPQAKIARALLTALDERDERVYARRQGAQDDEDDDDLDEDDEDDDDEA
ncbi:DUF7003 family protein [Polyangium spumosum]|uniref:Uncharacterized protein n=1 Tax=Polyangium spumosum TaxID=889282 RepID=A0A6N7PY06_9BACT|nr:hypothetical protein [Polyangium spumosum]MRG93641.1 hypothetical protein [Polyangium spumosum]